MGDVQVRVLCGADIAPYRDAVAALRIKVFRDFPYLYDGDLDFEAKYLRVYAESSRSVFVLALAQGRVIGASTGIPLNDDADAFQQPFRARGMAVDSVFYFGESVLLPDYRGRGLGHLFFDAREAHARAIGGFDWTAFAAVDRTPDDARRPENYRGNESFWQKRGYLRQPDMPMRLAWKELGNQTESAQTLTFWLRRLENV